MTRLLPFALLLLWTGACAHEEQGPAEPVELETPHVVVVLIDTFRPDHLGVLGYDRETAPFLEDLLRRSTVFRRAFSTSSWTAPSTSSLFTSLYPTRHGVTEGFLAHQKRVDAVAEQRNERITLNRLPSEFPTLPELLQQAGYQTFGAASNINIGGEIGFDRGFDHFHHLRDRSAEALAKELKAWRHKVPDGEPTFTYLHFNDVHEPYDPREPWYEEKDDELGRIVSAYNSEISYLDGVLEELYRDLSWDQDTLVVLVSDHGEEFREHGQIGHQFTLYDELMRVLIAFSGEGIPARFEEGVNVSLIDVIPTILEVLELPEASDRDGLSLAPFLASEPPPEVVNREFQKRVLFAHRSHYRTRRGLPEAHLWAAVRGPWKLIQHGERKRLFHLEEDPGETEDRKKEDRAIARELASQLDEFQAPGIQRGETMEVEIDEETRRSLEALGYVQ